ncbi:transposable element Tcb2 transposase [Trichonephila clavipes]|nr:transposable element Tcb2 transposase [Trichonephila clavipes]
MVWGGIKIGGRTDLHIIRNGTLTGRRSRQVENMLEAETIQRMEWTACSPDLNPIEHVWDMLGRRIAARPRSPATVRDLEIALLEEWNSIPQSLIDNLIASMANRWSVEARPPVFKSPRKLGTHLSTHCSRDERRSRLCPCLGIEPGPVVGKRDTLPLDHWALKTYETRVN